MDTPVFIVKRNLLYCKKRCLLPKWFLFRKCISGRLSPSGSWPRGRYCISRKGGSCARGFTTGSVYWDDEDLFNNWNVARWKLQS